MALCRRDFLAAASALACSSPTTVRVQASAAPVVRAGTWPEVAALLARMENRYVREEYPDWWRLHYTGAIEWVPDVWVIYGQGTLVQAAEDASRLAKVVEQCGCSILGAGASRDGRTWALVVHDPADGEVAAPIETLLAETQERWARERERRQLRDGWALER